MAAESNKKLIMILADASKDNNLKLAGELANLGWQIALVSHQAPIGAVPKNVRFLRIHLPIAYPLSYLAFFELALIIFRLRPALIHALHLSDYGILAGLSRRFLLSRLVLVSATGTDVMKDAFTLRGWSIKHILCLVEEVTCRDEAAKSAALQLGTPDNRLTLIVDNESSAAEFDAIYRKMLTAAQGGKDRKG